MGPRTKGWGQEWAHLTSLPVTHWGTLYFPSSQLCVGLEVQVPKGSNKGSTECHLCTLDSVSREQQVRRVTAILAGVSGRSEGCWCPTGVDREERRRAGDPLGASGDSPFQL